MPQLANACARRAPRARGGPPEAVEAAAAAAAEAAAVDIPNEEQWKRATERGAFANSTLGLAFLRMPSLLPSISPSLLFSRSFAPAQGCGSTERFVARSMAPTPGRTALGVFAAVLAVVFLVSVALAPSSSPTINHPKRGVFFAARGKPFPSNSQTSPASSVLSHPQHENANEAAGTASTTASAEGATTTTAAGDSDSEVNLGSDGDLPVTVGPAPSAVAPSLLVNEPQQYGVMIDAGSTGTRVRVYRWRLRLKAAHLSSSLASLSSPFASVIAPQPPISRPRTQVDVSSSY